MTPDTAELKALLARVGEAEGPDLASVGMHRNLDERIAQAFFSETQNEIWMREIEELPAFSSSIDAALALTERVLRTYSLKLVIDPSGNGAHLTWWPKGLSNADTAEITVDGLSVEPALAIIAATLKAKIAESGQP